MGTREHERTIQVQEVRIVDTERSRRPIEAAVTPIDDRRHIDAAGIEEVIREVSG